MSSDVRRAIAGLLRSLRRGGPRRHLTDRELARALAHADDGGPSGAGAAHLAGCARCAARLRALRVDLDRIAAAAGRAFDEALPPWRLARQRRRIVGRIRRAASGPGSARILLFPTAPRPASADPRRNRRWLSLAAAGGLLLAVVIGQAVDLGERTARNPESTAAAPAATTAAAPPAPRISAPPASPPVVVADEQFLWELEEALTSSRVTPLVALDELTPRVRPASIDVR